MATVGVKGLIIEIPCCWCFQAAHTVLRRFSQRSSCRQLALGHSQTRLFTAWTQSFPQGLSPSWFYRYNHGRV